MQRQESLPLSEDDQAVIEEIKRECDLSTCSNEQAFKK
jgi:hypothetical protein